MELDHIVLNVGDIDRSVKFYTEVLNLKPERLEEFREGKVGFPSVRINADTIIDLFPRRGVPTASNGTDQTTGMVDCLKENGIEILRGPVSRWGARGRATSVYFLDPDSNEIEIRSY
jgi:catechol 2,3-dioxygenase-like lactoylglutathione lyase family enzyme